MAELLKVAEVRMHAAQNCQEPAKMCTFERKIGKTGILNINWHSLTKFFKFLLFLWHLKPIYMRAFLGQKICLCKKFTFRRSGK